jgi:two-component system, chemotaxis family, protein-glutamate methylesterase/glutaminase
MAKAIRVGVALDRALARQSVRDVLSPLRQLELVVNASTATSLLMRHRVESLDRLVVDSRLADSHQMIASFVADHGRRDLVVISDEPRTAFERFGLRSAQIIPTPPTDLAFGDAVARFIQRTGHDDSPPAELASSTTVRSPGALNPSAVTSGFKRREIVVLGCSTGGPEALAVLLAQLPANFPVPIVIVQHMPPNFTRMLAERLDKACPLRVQEVSEPVTARPGEIWIAPGDSHIVLTSSAGRIELNDGPEENNCRPSVDVLFRSAAEHYGRRAVAVILTGMGDDGCRGARQLVDAGAHLIAQDKETSVVWGMPGAVVRAGLAHSVVPLSRVSHEICEQFLATSEARR